MFSKNNTKNNFVNIQKNVPWPKNKQSVCCSVFNMQDKNYRRKCKNFQPCLTSEVAQKTVSWNVLQMALHFVNSPSGLVKDLKFKVLDFGVDLRPFTLESGLVCLYLVIQCKDLRLACGLYNNDLVPSLAFNVKQQQQEMPRLLARLKPSKSCLLNIPVLLCRRTPMRSVRRSHLNHGSVSLTG